MNKYFPIQVSSLRPDVSSNVVLDKGQTFFGVNPSLVGWNLEFSFPKKILLYKTLSEVSWNHLPETE